MNATAQAACAAELLSSHLALTQASMHRMMKDRAAVGLAKITLQEAGKKRDDDVDREQVHAVGERAASAHTGRRFARQEACF